MKRCATKPASKGEKELIECCERLGICVVGQKSFADLRGTRGGLLRFDVFTTNTQPPLLIECQGKGCHGTEAKHTPVVQFTPREHPKDFARLY